MRQALGGNGLFSINRELSLREFRASRYRKFEVILVTSAANALIRQGVMNQLIWADGAVLGD